MHPGTRCNNCPRKQWEEEGLLQGCCCRSAEELARGEIVISRRGRPVIFQAYVFSPSP